jgi:hypothetical protein
VEVAGWKIELQSLKLEVSWKLGAES